jgi:F-type H+-transporting ATPase subunit a
MDLDVHVELAAETVFHIGPIPITNSMLTMWGVMVIILLIFWLAARKGSLIPGRFQSVIELVVEFISDLVYGTAGRRLGRRILPLVMGLFVFIWIANLSGLLPGVGTIGKYEESSHAADVVEHDGEAAVDDEHAPASGEEEVADTDSTDATAAGVTEAEESAADEEDHGKVLVPFLRAPNADLNMTLAMALIAIGVVQVAGIRAHGVGGRIKHMADPPFLFPIEVIGEVSRIVSLSARLFGNVFAGEVLLGVMFALGAALKIAVLPLVFPVIFLLLEVMFGTIQALVFSLLTLIYITLAAADSHGHEEEHAHGESKDHQPVAVPAVGD